MAPATATMGLSTFKGDLTWRPTKIMNMTDLSKDDDFLSHLLVEKLGTGVVPLLVHKMDPSRRLPKTDAQDLLAIVRRLVISKSPIQNAVRQAVDELLALPPIRYYLKSYTQKQINAFATHASRYFELYNPLGYIEIAHTSRYSHRTGKSELCILATRNLPTGSVITELKGSMANLTDEEDRELKRTDLRHSDARRDFSVIHSKQMKKNHLFLGPARFVNHDCDNNCELFREGKYITFRTLRPISAGAEITAHYGDGYFGRKNRHCLCETCEKLGRGGYAPENVEDDPQPDSDIGSNSDSDTSSSDSDTGGTSKSSINLNERRTRRGVYAILTKKDDESDESDDEDNGVIPLADAPDIPTDGEIELTTDLGTPSDLTSLSTSVAPPDSASVIASSSALPTPSPDARLPSCSSLSSLSCESLPISKSSFRSIIRRQKAREGHDHMVLTPGEINHQLNTPPLSEDAVSLSELSITSTKRITRSASSIQPPDKNKGKVEDVTPISTPTKSGKATGKVEINIKKEETEPRSLRARPSPANFESVKDPPPEPSIPRGPDGKLLPVCMTCSNVLPVISVDSKVVWGLGVENSPRRKKNKQECPRCMRHAAIYGQPWPCRTASLGSGFPPTPREEATPAESVSSKRFTKKTLSILDRKLAAAASASMKPRKRSSDSVEPPAKKQRMEPSPGTEVEVKVKKVPPREQRKKWHGLPLHKVAEKRKRGRPRLTSPQKVIKVEEEVRILPQPRNQNGRFERKIRSLKKPTSPTGETLLMTSSNAQKAVERTNTHNNGKGLERIVGTWTSPRRKRPSDTSTPIDTPGNKKGHWRPGEDVGEDSEPLKKILPRPVSNFRGGKLFSNPNPLSFALQAWAGPMNLDESSEDEKPPVTPPDDDKSLPPAIVEADSTVALSVTSLLIASPAIPFAALTFKPSPFNFAKRRWVSTSVSCLNGKSRRVSQDGSLVEDKELLMDDEFPVSGYTSQKGRHSSSSTYTHQSQFGRAYSSEKKDGIADDPIGQLTPVLNHYPSALSSDDDEKGSDVLCRSYPVSREAIRYPTVTLFASNEGPAPSLVHAGWDSCSEISDI